MVRYLKESDVEQLRTMPLALEQVKRALKDRALGRAVDVPRVRTHIPAPDDIPLYESHGMGIEDLYIAGRLVALARERGVGVDLPIGD